MSFSIPQSFKVSDIIDQTDGDFIDWGTKLIGADKVWDKYTGKGIKVCVLDTGIDYNHLDLKDNIKEVVSIVGDNGLDIHSHGTHVSGIIGAVNNGIGVIGVAPEASIYSVKVANNDGTAKIENINKGFEWALANKMDIISMSIGGGGSLPVYVADTIRRCQSAGIIVVVAAGNNGEWGSNTLSSFAKLDTTIGVGAIALYEDQKYIAPFSSIGQQLDYVMPGSEIYSCFPDNKYVRCSGTSMATPFLSGCISLVQEKSLKTIGRKLTFKEVVEELNRYTEDMCNAGFDIYSGNGLVHIDKILESIVTPTPQYWRCQLGAFKVQANAIAFRDKLKSQGINAIIKYVEPYWKTQVGAYSIKLNCENKLQEMKKLGFTDAFMVYY
jgi:hypothetical protein